jgi:adenine-specific DNA-methyltransferase
VTTLRAPIFPLLPASPVAEGTPTAADVLAPAGRALAGRFGAVSACKANGATYTPPALAAYLASQLASVARPALSRGAVHVLDPALGDGALAVALLRALTYRSRARISLTAYETNPSAAASAKSLLESSFADVRVEVRTRDFLAEHDPQRFDLAIANPPYVRTQILGANEAGKLATRFGLAGRVDLYQAFTLALIERLAPGGALALIAPNRFLSIKGASAFRDAVQDRLQIARIWDLGDTRIFNAAVLPAMLVGCRRDSAQPATASHATFTSIYEQPGAAGSASTSLVAALDQSGTVCVEARTFQVRQGHLNAPRGEVWRLSSNGIDRWLATVQSHTWRRLGNVGKIRVGVKTTADKVFIRSDWGDLGADAPELLRPLITHQIADRFRSRFPVQQIVYPHLDNNGRRTVADLRRYPRTAAYLEQHRKVLESRKYVIDAGRQWYELWVPHHPHLWGRPKLVFRDIAEKPTFWVDRSGGVVNGDCYWMVTDAAEDEPLLWLAVAVMNSTFIEAFYDRCFNNKLYAGRRRFMSQYVEQFPLPDPTLSASAALMQLARRRYSAAETTERIQLERSMDTLVWKAFGLQGQQARAALD